MKHASVGLLMSIVLVQGCVAPSQPDADPIDACRASELQYLVGKPGVLLDGMRFSQDVRVIQPGVAVTMDLKPDRLNFWLNDRDVIERVTCG